MRFSNILFALPLAHSAIAAPLLGGLLSGLLGGGVSSPSTAGGDKAGKALDIVTKLGDSIVRPTILSFFLLCRGVGVDGGRAVARTARIRHANRCRLEPSTALAVTASTSTTSIRSRVS